jgi:hypothetical protein
MVGSQSKKPTGIKQYDHICSYYIPEKQADCNSIYSVKYDHSLDEIKSVEPVGAPDYHLFWINIGKEMLKGNLEFIDKRAEYMLTTIAALIAIDFGVLLAFDVPNVTLKLVPQAIFSFSAIFFFYSLQLRKYNFNMYNPDEVKSSYNDIRERKFKAQRTGYLFFIAGLFAMALTYLIEIPTPKDPLDVSVNGNLTIVGP